MVFKSDLERLFATIKSVNIKICQHHLFESVSSLTKTVDGSRQKNSFF